MLPSLVAEDLRNSLTSFLGTTFALADDDVRAELERFIANPDDGVFRGPYVRLRTPFRPADDSWRRHLDWAPQGFRPHKHQAEAWKRLASGDRLPEPTLVTTGTGSGKTESFLVPLLEHCRRELRKGRPGIKAIVLYPMNALANDQARRIARLVHEHRDALGDVTVGLYTGDSGHADAMTETSVIENKRTMRQRPPDVLLTNYKMLDMLLLRSEDAPLFARAGESLRYLVLDEFHTYDGAQGTDVAMLLRRLGTVLGVTTDDRPLGAVTPVATSATLGSGAGAADELRTFARTVFGTEFDGTSLIGEDRLSPRRVGHRAAGGRGAAARRDHHRAHRRRGTRGPAAGRRAALPARHPQRGRDPHPRRPGAGTRPAGPSLDAHAAGPDDDPAVTGRRRGRGGTELVDRDRSPAGRGPTRGLALPRAALPSTLTRGPPAARRRRPAVAAGGQSAAAHGVQRPAIRMVRGSAARGRRALPALGVLSPLRSVRLGHRRHSRGSHATTPTAVWGKALSDPSSARAWIFAPGEADQGAEEVRWVDPEIVDFVPWRSGRHSDEVPVLATPDGDAARKQQCPSCGQDDPIRFLGSRVATLASATLGQLFGSSDVAGAEKKTLVFTDSVQDASHRAAFVESRAYALNLRALLHRALGDGTTLDALGEAVDQAGRSPAERFAALPHDLRAHETFALYGADDPEPHVRRAVATRMGFNAVLEFGLASRTGRTLELTGAATAHVEVDDLATPRPRTGTFGADRRCPRPVAVLGLLDAVPRPATGPRRSDRGALPGSAPARSQ